LFFATLVGLVKFNHVDKELDMILVTNELV